ncbi:MAG: ferrous iron transport protein A [Acetobacteraceae bacterium]|nr:ferrous iron transport protein A [Acetobacteraceae bacterium]
MPGRARSGACEGEGQEGGSLRGALSLAGLQRGRQALVLEVGGGDPVALRRLAGLGLFPGARIRLVQAFPAYVLELGHTVLALDRDLARRVRVLPLEGTGQGGRMSGEGALRPGVGPERV